MFMEGIYLVGNIGGDDIDIVYVTEYLTPFTYRKFFKKIREFYRRKKFIVEYGPIIENYGRKVGHVCMLSMDMHVADLPLSQWIKEQKILSGDIPLNEVFEVPEITPRKVLWGAYGLDKLYRWLKNSYVVNYKQIIFKNKFVNDVVFSYKKMNYGDTPLKLLHLLKYSLKFTILNLKKIGVEDTSILEDLYERVMHGKNHPDYSKITKIRKESMKEIKNKIVEVSKKFSAPKPIIKYKKIKIGDVDDVAKFYNSLFYRFKMIPRIKPVDAQEIKLWKRRISSGSTVGYAVYDISQNKKVIGASTVIRFPFDVNNIPTYRISVSIEPFYLNSGIGTPLIGNTIEQVSGVIISDTHINNFPMHTIMKRAGFRNITYLKNSPPYHQKLVKSFEEIYGKFNNDVYHLWELRR